MLVGSSSTMRMVGGVPSCSGAVGCSSFSIERHYAAYRRPRTGTAEAALFEDLRRGRLGERVRLEQERIAFGWVRGRLRQL
ncbi:Wadjet anti-phage system protein JetD domain-containing protein [Halorhodospira halophila]|uniref:Wadjet anti-phage system protein JetD domain-containing protein n=1 Tax=Halorhodospira TaxID=85108 RepID=UPI0030841C4B